MEGSPGPLVVKFADTDKQKKDRAQQQNLQQQQLMLQQMYNLYAQTMQVSFAALSFVLACTVRVCLHFLRVGPVYFVVLFTPHNVHVHVHTCAWFFGSSYIDVVCCCLFVSSFFLTIIYDNRVVLPILLCSLNSHKWRPKWVRWVHKWDKWASLVHSETCKCPVLQLPKSNSHPNDKVPQALTCLSITCHKTSRTLT